MPKRDIERELDRISALRGAQEGATTILSAALKDSVGVVVARAAKVAADLQLRALAPELVGPYERFFIEGPKKDPQCTAKTALARALRDLGWTEAGPFLRGVRYVQMDPVWGGQEDSAAGLRATCVLALSQCTDIPYAEILRHAVDAMGDRFASVRSDAVRALAFIGGNGCALLLRLKARLGDEDARVTGEALEALIAIEGEAGVVLAKEFLDRAGDAVQDEAALALGASRHGAAIDTLIERWREKTMSGQSGVILRALGIARDGKANALLLECVLKGRTDDAATALEALAGQTRNDELRAAVLEAVRSRNDERITRIAMERFE